MWTSPEKLYRVKWCVTISRSFKIIEIGTNRKPICDFLLIFLCNYISIFHRFRYIEVKKERIVLREIHLRTTDVTCQWDHTVLSATRQVGTRFVDPVRLKGWVGLVGWLHTEMVYPSTDGHPSWY